MRNSPRRQFVLFAVISAACAMACSTARQYQGSGGVTGGIGGNGGSGHLDGGTDSSPDLGVASGGASAMGGQGGSRTCSTGGASGVGGAVAASGGTAGTGLGTGGTIVTSGGSPGFGGGGRGRVGAGTASGGTGTGGIGGITGSGGSGGAGGGATSCLPACIAPLGGTTTCANGTCLATCMTAGNTVCGNTCVDKSRDAKNCGSCGHDCLGGTCELGTCQASKLASGQGYLTTITLDVSHVYWGGTGVLGQAAKNTPGSTTIAMTSADSLGIAGGRIYWADGAGAQPNYWSCALPNCAGGAVTVTGGANFYTTVIGDRTGQNIFWEASYPGPTITWALQSLNITNKVVTTLLTDLPEVSPLAIDDNFLYLTDGGQNIEKIPIAGGVPTMLAAKDPTVAVRLITACGPHLYWATYSSTSAIYSAPLPNGTGGETVPVFAMGLTGQNIEGLACDDSGVYWSNWSNAVATTVVMCPHEGCDGPPKVLATGQDRPAGIATDPRAIYWVTMGGDVYELAK